MNLNDSLEQIRGEVCVRPFDRNGNTLKDPLSIFPFLGESERRKMTVSESGFILLEENLVVNLGRQTIANLIGGKDYPSNNWVVSQVSWGVGEEVPRFNDNSVSPQAVNGETIGGENEIKFDSVNKKKTISSTDWPSPFIVRFEATLGADEAVGYLIREAALWTSNNTLFARKVFPAINKSSDIGLSFIWSVRT